MSAQDTAGTLKLRRSERREFVIPIQVFGTNLKGRDFVEKCISLKISRHGALIRLQHWLIVEDTIRILNPRKNAEAVYRVVAQVTDPPDAPYSDWGVEVLDMKEEIWG